MELKEIQEEEGRFTYDNSTYDNGDLQVYTQVQFINITCDRRKGLPWIMRFISPKIHGVKSEIEYWKKSKDY